MRIFVNGKEYQIVGGASLAEAMQQLNLAGPGVAVAVNSEVIPQTEWPSCALKEDDAIMVIRATRGG